MTKQDLILNKMRELQDTMNTLSYDFVEQYQVEDINYLGDLFHEFADSNTSIYYSEQREFYDNNIDACNDAINEYYGSFSEFVKSLENDINSLDELIDKAGALGEFYSNYNELCENEEDIIRYYVLENVLEFDDYFTFEEIEKIIFDLEYFSDYDYSYIDDVEELRDYLNIW